MVPVIKHCQRMGITEIAKAISELSTKARTSKLTPDDVSEGTITLTNFGMSGVQIGIRSSVIQKSQSSASVQPTRKSFLLKMTSFGPFDVCMYR